MICVRSEDFSSDAAEAFLRSVRSRQAEGLDFMAAVAEVRNREAVVFGRFLADAETADLAGIKKAMRSEIEFRALLERAGLGPAAREWEARSIRFWKWSVEGLISKGLPFDQAWAEAKRVKPDLYQVVAMAWAAGYR